MLFQRAHDGDALGWMGIAVFALSDLPAWSRLGPIPSSSLPASLPARLCCVYCKESSAHLEIADCPD